MGPQDAIFLFKIHPTAMSRRDTKFSSAKFSSVTLSLWCPLLPYGYSYKASCARPGRAERQSARTSKITNDGLTRSGTGCFIPVPIRQHWASKGYGQGRVSVGSHT